MIRPRIWLGFAGVFLNTWSQLADVFSVVTCETGKSFGMRFFSRADRRIADRRRAPAEMGGKRRRERRKGERRRFFRVHYPGGAAPRILNADFHIINISQGGIAFACRRPCDKCTKPIVLGEMMKLEVEFHDGQIVDVDVKVMRCQGDVSSRENHYAGTIEQGIDARRVAKEQAYLLRVFPDFARASATIHHAIGNSIS